MKIAFFGTSEFGIPTLEILHREFDVEFVVTNPPRPAKRGKNLLNTPIFEYAKKLGIEHIYTPEKLTSEFVQHLKNIDYGVVVSYGKILPETIINSVKKKFINLHPSNLPLFRGATPIERTLEAGYDETEICVIEMTKKLDAGDILLKKHYNISTQENAIDLHKKFSHIGAELVHDVISNNKVMHSEKQDDTSATYAHKIIKKDLELELQSTQSAKDILNKIRAFASCGHCFVFYNQKRFKIIKATVSDIRKTPIDINCIDGLITPLIIRPEGRGDIKICDYQF